ncbi:MAG: fibro-slime domain-containing protein [Acutalibacteraceae bacterium]|nr:fibro-slime domain-containing protein [Acutalibacteraceae bacterium]
MQKRVYEQVNKSKRALSLLLTLLIVFSMCVVGEISASAASFSAGQYVYLDVQEAKNWKDGNAKTKCFMYRYNNDSQSSYVDCIEMELVRGQQYLYRCFILGNDVNYLKFSRGDGNANWNWAGGDYAYHGRDGSKNCFFVYSGDFKSGSWGTLRGGITDPDNHIQSNAQHYNIPEEKVTFQNKSSQPLRLVDATFYDYYDNDEMVYSNYWIDGLDESQRNYKDREPFTFFNYAIGRYASSKSGFSTPLYFGDFMRSSAPWYDGYTGAGVSQFYNYKSRYNNSNATGYGTSGSVQGLVDQTLSNGKVTKGGVQLPYFNEAFLKSDNILGKPIGSVVSTKFPFRSIKDSSGDTHYVYNSDNGTDNFYFSGLKTNNVKANYNYNYNKAIDAATGFGGTSNGYGFFPFDDVGNNSQVLAKNFGFGMKLTIPFSIGSTKKTPNGKDVIFKFTGDDDVWVFVDGKLVLDLGGAHKKASGEINFTQKTVTYHTQYGNVNNSRSATSQTISSSALSDFVYGASHEVVVFYMERGMVESNLNISFNFAPEVELITTKDVNVANVNDGLKDKVAKLDKFTFTNRDVTTNSPLASKTYTDANNNKYTSNTSGSYNMSDDSYAKFSDIVPWDSSAYQKVGDRISVSETVPATTKLKYDTSYNVTDLYDEKVISSASGLTSDAQRVAEFNFTANQDAKDYVGYQVDFVNTPIVSNLSVSKYAYDKDNYPLTNTSFGFSIMLNIDGTYRAYPLKYTVNGAVKTATSGVFYLKHNETAVFSGIPVGVAYKVVETTTDGYTVSPSDTISGTVNTYSNRVSFTNKEKIDVVGEVSLKANKTVDGRTPKDNEIFSFTVQELIPNSSNTAFSKGDYSETKQNSGGEVVFSPIVYTTADLPTEAPTQKPTDPPTEEPTQKPTEKPTEKPTQKPTEPPTQKPTDPPSNSIYFKPSENWKRDNARFAAYFFNSSADPVWVSLTYDSSTGYYKGTLPSVTRKYVIFVRMNPSSSTNDWNNKWNQTADLTISGNCFVLDSNGWDNIGGTWSTISARVASYSNGLDNDSSIENTVITKEDKVIPVESLASTGYVYRYYSVSENKGTDSEMKYDSTVYYCKVAINVATKKITTYYYNSLQNMIKGTPTIQPTQMIFKNQHIGSLTISKITKDSDQIQKPLTGVKFVLYKLTNKDQIAEEGTIVDRNGNTVTTSLSQYAGEEVNSDGLLTYKNLAVSSNPADTSLDNKQWYCVKELKTVDGYALSTKEYRFYLPQLEVVEDTYGDYDVAIDNVKYQYKYSISQTFVNSAITAPYTAGSGIGMYVVVGLSLMLVGTVMAVAMQRKRRKETAC